MSPRKKREYRIEIVHSAYLAAAKVLAGTAPYKKDRAERISFFFGNNDFRISVGTASVGLPAQGFWPAIVSIHKRFFDSLIKFPPPNNPLIFEVRGGKFICGTWSCSCHYEDSIGDADSENVDELPQEENSHILPPKTLLSPSPNASIASRPLTTSTPSHKNSNSITKPVRNILDDLENIRENLLAFSDDVWLNIEHNDSQAVDEGVIFKKRLNTQIDAFGKLSDEMTRLIQEYTQVQADGEASAGTEVGSTSTENSRIIKELNQNEAHAVDEDFTYKRPCGFVLDGIGYQEINTWSRVYELILRQLAKEDPATFTALPDNPKTITRRDNRHFSRNPSELRKALSLPNGLSAEINLSANHICASIRTILEIFSLPPSSCTLFLRQDRDA